MKRPLRLMALLMPLLALLVLAAPVSAAPTRVDALPSVEGFTSARYDFALTLFGAEIAYGKGEVESASRVHLTLKTVAFEGTPSETLEVVIYDGTYYVRENDSTQWYIESAPDTGVAPPSTEVGDTSEVALSLIGPAEVAGVATDQYQLWQNDAEVASTADFFIGTSRSLLHKLQISGYVLDGADLIPVIGLDYRFYDFNASDIKVYAPANAVRRAGSAAYGSLDWAMRSAPSSLSAWLSVVR
jgi:hypothetical protein